MKLLEAIELMDGLLGVEKAPVPNLVGYKKFAFFFTSSGIIIAKIYF